MAINATGLIFEVPAWPVFSDFDGDVVLVEGTELGDDDTVVLGLVPGIKGEAMAPFPDPGRVGSLTRLLHFCSMGDPQRPRF